MVLRSGVHYFSRLRSFNICIISFIEIEARSEMESDKKLDKLESFLGRLNSKSMNFLSDL